MYLGAPGGAEFVKNKRLRYNNVIVVESHGDFIFGDEAFVWQKWDEASPVT